MSSTERVFIGLGSNMGNRRVNCGKAVESLRVTPSLRLIRQSPLYETAPWGLYGQRPFVNAAIEIRTALGPFGLLALLKGVERELGRGHGRRWGPRVIDLDILFFGSRIVDTKMLRLPHSHFTERAFALLPMVDIAPDFIHPGLNISMRGLAGRLTSRAGVKRVVLDES